MPPESARAGPGGVGMGMPAVASGLDGGGARPPEYHETARKGRDHARKRRGWRIALRTSAIAMRENGCQEPRFGEHRPSGRKPQANHTQMALFPPDVRARHRG